MQNPKDILVVSDPVASHIALAYLKVIACESKNWSFQNPLETLTFYEYFGPYYLSLALQRTIVQMNASFAFPHSCVSLAERAF